MSISTRGRKARKRKLRADDNELETQKSPIDALNDDCLLYIFSYLSLHDRARIERVSKRWQSLNTKAWNNFDHLELGLNIILKQNSMHMYEHSIDDKSIEKILSRCGRFLTTIIIHSFELTCMYVLPSIRRHCKNLTHLELRLDTYSEDELTTIFSNCKKLKYLKLSELEGSFSGYCLGGLASNAIQEICLIATSRADLKRIGAESIRSMSKLHKLELQNFRVCSAAIECIAANQAISDLSLLNCHLGCGDLLTTMHGLKSLDLHNTSMKISGRSLDGIEKKFSVLQSDRYPVVSYQ